MKIVYIFILLLQSICSFAVDRSVLTMFENESIDLPVRVIPRFVPATRWVWLDKTQNLNLYEYPVLRMGQKTNLQLQLDAKGTGQVNTVVKVGDLKNNSEFVFSREDLSQSQFQKKNDLYRVLRRLGFDTGTNWRYVSDRVTIEALSQGKLSATVDPGGFFAFQKYIRAQKLTESPWLHYEYELPKTGTWFIEVSAKIKKAKFFGETVIVSSGPVWGGGKKTLVLNLLQLLKQSDPNINDGYLEELNIQFFLPNIKQSPQTNVQLDLGTIQFLKGYVAGAQNQIFIPLHGDTNSEIKNEINLYKSIEALLPAPNSLTLLGASGNTDAKLLADYQEKLPELFIGQQYLIEYLSDKDLSAVLDQKLFFSPLVVWQHPKAEILYRKPADLTELQISLNLNLALSAENYNLLYAEFLNEDESALPLVLVIFGLDQKHKLLKKEVLLHSGLPVNLSDFSRLEKIQIKFAAPVPSALLTKLEVLKFVKTKTFKPVQQTLELGLLPITQPVYKNIYENVEFQIHQHGDLQTIKTFPLNLSQRSDVNVYFEIQNVEGVKLNYALRARSVLADGGLVERVYPIDLKGELQLKNIRLQGLDLLAQIGEVMAAGNLQLILRSFEVRTQNLDIAENIAPLIPVKNIGWLREKYAMQLARPRLFNNVKTNITLQLNEILNGGRLINLPIKGQNAGDYLLASTQQVSGLEAVMESAFLAKRMEENSQQTIVKSQSKLIKLAKPIFILILLYLLYKYSAIWLATVDKKLKIPKIFWPSEVILFVIACVRISTGPRGASEGGLLLVLVFAIAARYYLRDYLGRRWSLLKERASNIYFVAFLLTLPFCVLLLVGKKGFAAEFLSMMGFYFLVLALLIEFAAFAKTSEFK